MYLSLSLHVNAYQHFSKSYHMCSCEKCNVSLLRNEKECKCCRELQGCLKAITDEVALEESPLEDIKCITDHPAFVPVILERWSLRQAADCYTTRDFRKYYKKGVENE